MSGYYLGADLGGTNFRVGIRAAGSADLLLDRESFAASTDWDCTALGETLRTGWDRILARHPELRAGSDGCLGLGFGLTGDIDPLNGWCRTMPRFAGLEDQPLGPHLEAQLGVPVRLLNDGLAATLAELRAGAGMGTRDWLLITLGTGIGCGVVLGGRLLVGEGGRIGRVGHQVIDLDGPLGCHCGFRGCWQTFAGKDGVTARAHTVAAAYPDSQLARALAEHPDLKRITELADAGDTASREVLRHTGTYVGIGLANLVKAFGPQKILVGGGIAEGCRWLLDAAQDAVHGWAVKPYQRVPVVPAGFGKDAGLIGAVLLAEAPVC